MVAAILAPFVGVAMLSPRLVRPLARVVGTPAHGSNPRQAFSSCAESAGANSACCVVSSKAACRPIFFWSTV